MKKIAIILLLALGFNSFSQVSFGVNLGKNTTSAQVGYLYKRFNPYASFQYASAKFGVEASIQDIDFNTGQLYTIPLDLSAKLTMLMPTIGLKAFVFETNKLKAFANISYSKPMLRASLDVGFPIPEIDLIEQQVRDIKLNSLAFGIGAEYFIDQNFSVGAEYGFMTTRMKTTVNFSQELYDPINNVFVNTTNTLDLKGALSPTYARLSLNFYFGK